MNIECVTHVEQLRRNYKKALVFYLHTGRPEDGAMAIKARIRWVAEQKRFGGEVGTAERR